MMWLNEMLNVNPQQAETSHWSQSITDCVKSSTAIQVMFWPQEPEQLTGPNMEPANQIKWCMTPSHKVHTGASLHQPQEQQQHNTHTHRHTTLFQPLNHAQVDMVYVTSYHRHLGTLTDPAVMPSHLEVLWNNILLIHSSMCKCLK